MRRFVSGLLIVISAVSLVLASTSLWTRRNVINTSVFVSNVETIVDLPQVEARITDRVTTTVMTNPDVQDAIDAGGRRAAATAAELPADRRGRHPVDHLGRGGATAAATIPSARSPRRR